MPRLRFARQEFGYKLLNLPLSAAALFVSVFVRPPHLLTGPAFCGSAAIRRPLVPDLRFIGFLPPVRAALCVLRAACRFLRF